MHAWCLSPPATHAPAAGRRPRPHGRQRPAHGDADAAVVHFPGGIARKPPLAAGAAALLRRATHAAPAGGSPVVVEQHGQWRTSSDVRQHGGGWIPQQFCRRPLSLHLVCAAQDECNAAILYADGTIYISVEVHGTILDMNKDGMLSVDTDRLLQILFLLRLTCEQMFLITWVSWCRYTTNPPLPIPVVIRPPFVFYRRPWPQGHAAAA
ncbi:hypothetical protein U9M48_032619 [Paspalum notatum var. saurae]|uniref:Uncharacterized protein n=1 Tax=Paspalum notatum var. saurae TaxID=547442 RepID=A0AAQ3U6E5_PASNO